ncbi:MAG: GNAT family N-acetyltransferase [Solobacterium sp.]|nr:GNAT family N-acetyltransferase [Solobacterium sp.]
MSIRILNRQEKEKAVTLIKEVMSFHSEILPTKKAEESFYAFLQEMGQQYSYYGYFDPELEGILGFHDDHIVFLFVRQDRQKEKIGTNLVHAFLKEEKEKTIRVTVNAAESACDFYAKLGFRQTGEPDIRDDIVSIPMEYLMQEEYLGKTVTVTVEHTYGSFHPLYADTQYECNYGYVEEILAGKGEFQEAYVYGPEEPLDAFTGIVIAVIYRRDDPVTRWVVAKDRNYAQEEVINTIAFQEQYFDTQIDWLK